MIWDEGLDRYGPSQLLTHHPKENLLNRTLLGDFGEHQGSDCCPPRHIRTKDQMETRQGCTCLLAQNSQCVRASPDTDSLLDRKPGPNCVRHVSLSTCSQVFQVLAENVHLAFPLQPKIFLDGADSWILLTSWLCSCLFWWLSSPITTHLGIKPNAQGGGAPPCGLSIHIPPTQFGHSER